MKKRTAMLLTAGIYMSVLCCCPAYAGQADFPEYYEKKSGQLNFTCLIEIPEEFDREALYETTVTGRRYIDQQKAFEHYVEGKEVAEEHFTPAENGIPEAHYYIFSDGSAVFYSDGFSMPSADSRFYINTYCEYPQFYEQKKVSFAEPEECVKQVTQIMDSLDVKYDDIKFFTYPLHHETMKEIETQAVAAGQISESAGKPEWTRKDDAYAVYGVQHHNGLPVFNENMSVGKQMAFDTPDSSPVLATVTEHGLVNLNIGNKLYDFKDSEKLVSLADFSEVTATLENKFNNLLTGSTYKVTRAKLYERVFLNQKQQYEVQPVWYFEVLENESDISVTLVDAVTAEEIYLQ